MVYDLIAFNFPLSRAGDAQESAKHSGTRAVSFASFMKDRLQAAKHFWEFPLQWRI
jgi:hypothetical protein